MIAVPRAQHPGRDTFVQPISICEGAGHEPARPAILQKNTRFVG